MIHLDFETRSIADLQNTGASYYSKHDSTRVLCVAYSIDGKKVKGRILFNNPKIPKKLLKAVQAGHTIAAHNARFEYLIWNNVLAKHHGWPELPIERFYCTMGLASRHGLPKGLDPLSRALKLKVKKDMEGKALMLKMASPRKPTKKDPRIWIEDEESLKRLLQYCKVDVKTEIGVCDRLKDPNPTDVLVWQSSQYMNNRGLYVDKKAIKKAIKIITKEKIRANKRIQKLSKGVIQKTTQTKVITEYCRKYGIKSLAAKQLEKKLEEEKFPRKIKEILQLRLDTAKSSTAKLERILERIEFDGRIRDLSIYHGAHTGRDTGVGPQPLNNPRGTLKYNQIVDAIKAIRNNDLDGIRKYGPIMHVISSCIRSFYKAPKGKVLVCADLAGIEARLNFWFANEIKVLNAFRKNKDIYVQMACDIYKKLEKQITPDERFIGKQAILGLGYQMGAPKFVADMRLKYNVIISLMFAKRVVKAFRDKFPKVKKNWKELESAAIKAIETGKRVKYKSIYYESIKDSLYCKLPSGRFMVYKYPGLEWGNYGNRKITYYGWKNKVFTKQTTYGGKLDENLIQAMARDILVRAILRLDAENKPVILSIYDEILSEQDKDKASLDEMISILTDVPDWAQGLPLKAEGWTGKRYRKG